MSGTASLIARMARDEVVAVERFLGSVGAKLLGRVRKEGDAGNAEVGRLARPRGELVDGPATDAWQRADRLLPVAAVAHEQGPNEVGRMKPVLGDHRAHPRARAAPAHADVRK